MVAGQTASYLVIGLCGVLSLITLICILVPGGWHISHVHWIVEFHTSLYHVTVVKGLGAELLGLVLKGLASLSSKSKKKMDGISFLDGSDKSLGTFGLQDMATRICAIPNPYCDDWYALVAGSYIMLFMGILAILMYWLAAGFLYYFWTNTATGAGRVSIRTFLILAPSLKWLGMLIYLLCSMNFGDTQKVVMLGPLPVPGGQQPLMYGAAFFFMVFATVLSIAPLLIFELCINHGSQIQVWDQRELKGQLAEEAYRQNIELGSYDQSYGQGGYQQNPQGGFMPPSPVFQPGYGQQPYGQQPPGYGQSPYY